MSSVRALWVIWSVMEKHCRVLSRWWHGMRYFNRVTLAFENRLSEDKYGKDHFGDHLAISRLVVGFPGDSEDKDYACIAGDSGLITGWGRSPGEGSGYPLQYSCLEHSMDSLADYNPWGCKESDMTEHWAHMYRPSKAEVLPSLESRNSKHQNRSPLNVYKERCTGMFTVALLADTKNPKSPLMGEWMNQENPLATHSTILAWKIPRTEEPGGLQFMGSQRVQHTGHAYTNVPWNTLQQLKWMKQSCIIKMDPSLKHKREW